MHRGRASVGTDAHINCAVVVKVKHAIDRGGGGGTQSIERQS